MKMAEEQAWDAADWFAIKRERKKQDGYSGNE